MGDYMGSCTSIVRVAKTMLNQSRQTNNIPMIIIVHCCDDVTPMEVEVNYNNNPRDSNSLVFLLGIFITVMFLVKLVWSSIIKSSLTISVLFINFPSMALLVLSKTPH